MHKPTLALFALLGTTLALPLSAMAVCVDINRTLKIGSTGTDIKSLQLFLNANNDTRIAESGPGSSGNETNYFGPASARALSRFQEKFSTEILVPSGITKGSGVLGGRSRSKLRALTCGDTATQNDQKPGLLIPVTDSKINVDDATGEDITAFKSEADLLAHADDWAAKNPDKVSDDFVDTHFNKGLDNIIAHEREVAAKNPKGANNHLSSVPIEIIGMMPASVWPGMITNVIGYGFGATNTVTINGRALEVYPASENGLALPVVIPSDIKPGTYTLHIKGGVSEADASIEVLEK